MTPGFGRSWSIKLRILLFQVLIGLAIVGIAVAVHLAVRQELDDVERVQRADRQLLTMTRIAVQATAAPSRWRRCC